MKTPMQMLLARLEELYDLNMLEPEYREGIADAIVVAKTLKGIETSHIKAAWRDAAIGIEHQTATDYYRSTYGLEDLSE